MRNIVITIRITVGKTMATTIRIGAPINTIRSMKNRNLSIINATSAKHTVIHENCAAIKNRNDDKSNDIIGMNATIDTTTTVAETMMTTMTMTTKVHNH